MIRWLWSVESMALPAHGFAVTLTTGGRPSSATEWAEARTAFVKRAKRLGLTAGHWVTEWTEAGRPHLHMALWYQPGRPWTRHLSGELKLDWLEIADSHGWETGWAGQHVAQITGNVGWSKYVSKHASRGVAHYQRQGIPDGWETTGRLWGHYGDWPVRAPYQVELDEPEFRLYKSLVAGHVDLERKARGVSDDVPYLPPVGGIGEWVPHAVAFGYLMRATSGRFEIQREVESNGNSGRSDRPRLCAPDRETDGDLPAGGD